MMLNEFVDSGEPVILHDVHEARISGGATYAIVTNVNVIR